MINLDLVCAAEREAPGKVVVYFAAGERDLQVRWVFEEKDQAAAVWNKLTANRGDLADLGGGPYSINDNETTASRGAKQ
ncbi:MAG TPA: hypothetical protein VIL86_20715 [Tepidisphaeraceae bacterium]